jgi:transposase-like protein
MAVERMKDCPSVSALAKELSIDRSNLYEWQRQLEHASESSARVTSPVRELRKQVRELQRVLAEKTLEVDFFKGALQKVEARGQSSKGSGVTAFTT